MCQRVLVTVFDVDLKFGPVKALLLMGILAKTCLDASSLIVDWLWRDTMVKSVL